MILYQCQYCTWYLISLLAFVHNLSSILPFCPPPSPPSPPPFYFDNDTLCFNVSLNTQSGPFHKFEVIETSSFLFVPIKFVLCFNVCSNDQQSPYGMVPFILYYIKQVINVPRLAVMGTTSILYRDWKNSGVCYMKKHVSQGRLRRRLCVL